MNSDEGSGANVRSNDELGALVKRLRLQPEDNGGPSRMDMLRERLEAADEIERLREGVKQYRDALEFYANPEIYKPHPHGPAFDRGDHSWLARGVLLTPNP